MWRGSGGAGVLHFDHVEIRSPLDDPPHHYINLMSLCCRLGLAAYVIDNIVDEVSSRDAEQVRCISCSHIAVIIRLSVGWRISIGLRPALCTSCLLL